MMDFQSQVRFQDRAEAGKQLAERLDFLKEKKGVVLALPRGGVPVGVPIAKKLGWPLEVLVVRKLGARFNTEYGIGAVSEEGVVVWSQDVIEELGIEPDYLIEVLEKEREELGRRVESYRHNQPLPRLENKTALVIDDGLATGVTAHAAVKTAKELGAKKVLFVAPVCSLDSMARLEDMTDEVVCLLMPPNLRAIGEYYNSFEQVSDDDVSNILRTFKKDQGKTN